VTAPATQRTSAESSELRPVTTLRGVGESLAEKLSRLAITTVQDLLFLLPLRYEDRTRVVPIGSLRVGERAVIEGEVLLCEVAFRGRRQLLCRIGDGSGSLTLRFFHFSGSQQQGLTRGTRLRCFGEIRRGPGGPEIVHPEYRRIGIEAGTTEETLTPIYPLTEGVQQGRLRQLTGMALREFSQRAVREWIPPAILQPLNLPPLHAALDFVHRPPPDADIDLLASGRHPMQRRLAFEELLAHQLSLRLLRREISAIRVGRSPLAMRNRWSPASPTRCRSR
jgi:ATP-dependent DNA helicase RecG